MKMRAAQALQLFLLISFSLLIFGCANKECGSVSDCPAKTCYTPACTNNACSYSVLSRCCGNAVCEAGEAKCNCSNDCGRCEGKKGKFLSYQCAGSECRVDSQRENQTMYEDHQFSSFFMLGIATTLEQPFDLAKSRYLVRYELKDDSADLILPVKINSIRVLDREVLLGEVASQQALNQVGDIVSYSFPLSFAIDGTETEKLITVKLDYEYVRRVPTSATDLVTKERIYEPSPPQRETYTRTFTQRFDFIDSSG